MLTAAILLPLLLIFISRIFYAISGAICKLIDVLYECFEVFAGVKTITFNEKPDYLIDVFFSNDIISTVYWGMACNGFAMLFGFAIVAVVRKIFDSTGEKVKATYSHILLNCFKSLLLILLMTAIVSATITASGTLMRAISKLFDQAELIANPTSITFTDEDFATMYRIFNTIGNYGLNPSYENRYNLNACFNDIRNDMQDLARKRVFDFSYMITDSKKIVDGRYVLPSGTGSFVDLTRSGSSTENNYDLQNSTWQYALLQIYKTGDIYKDMDIDAVDEDLHQTLLNCMHQLKTNTEFKPLKEYVESDYNASQLGVTIGRTIMLTASFGNAKNSNYDKHPGVTDPLRVPYYTGEKNIYDYDTADEDFEVGIFHWNHLMVIVVGFFVTKEMLIILINATARIFNIILLYLTAPGFLAVMPLDDGGKFKQWTTAFVIQSLSLIGSLFAVRLLVIFVPMVMSSELVLFDNVVANYIGKLAFLIGICVTSEKASGMISGILADNAGYQSIMAGDVGGGVANAAKAIAGKAIKMAAGAAMTVGKGFAGAVDDFTGVSAKKDKLADKIKNFGASIRENGFAGAKKKGFQSKEDIKKQEAEDKEAASQKDTKDFRSDMKSMMTQMLEQNGGNPTNNASPQGGSGDEGGEGTKDAPPGENA